MKSTLRLRFSLQNKTRSLLPPRRGCRAGGPGLLPVLTRRLFLLTLVSCVAVAALLGIAASANKAKRAAKAREAQAAASKPAIIKNSIEQKPNAPLAVGVTATLTDNTAQATKVAPGATVNYTAVITSTGGVGEDATAVNYNAPLDTNTTIVAGSVHASPIAFNDTYNWVGNTQLDSTARALPAVTANDVAVNATLPAPGTDTFNVVTQTNAPTALAGGLVTLNANGSFVYTPPVGRPNIADGASVNDSFTYTITNSADATLVGTGTVTIALTGRVWYLQAGASGTGLSNDPSGSPSAMSTAADKSTDIFYIFSNAGSLNGLFSLDNSQQLLGQGVNLVVNTITLFTAAAPTPTTTNGGGNGVTLGNGNTLSGFNIGNCTGTAISGTNVGTLTVNDLSINTTGAGLDLTGVATPTVSVVLGGLTSTGGTKNVNLVGLNGTVTLASGALSGASGNAFDVTGAGTANISYSGTITNTAAARLINISGKTGGTVAFSGALSGTGSSTGINLSSNTGATISFTGGINLSTGASAAFTATGGGTVTATQDNTSIVNTLTTTTATALNVANTTIGAAGLTFRSISSGTAGANSGPNGIILNTTGSSGGLTVTGNSSAGSGGTIQRKTGADGSTTDGTGIFLNSTSNVSLAFMTLRDFQNYGIRGLGVSGFSMDNCTVDVTNFSTNGTTAASDEASASFGTRAPCSITGLTGTATFTNSTIRRGFEDDLSVFNFGLPALNLTIDNCIIRDTGDQGVTSTGNDGVIIEGHLTANISIDLKNSQFIGNGGDHINATADDSAILNVNIGANGANTLTGGNPVALGQSITIQTGGQWAGSGTFNVSNNSIVNAIDTPININAGGSGTFQGTINNNTIGTSGVANSGTVGNKDAIRVVANGDKGALGANANGGTLTVAVTNNTIQQVSGNGIFMIARDGGSVADPIVLNVTVTGNLLRQPAPGANGIRPEAGASSLPTPDRVNLCIDIGGAGALANNVQGDWGAAIAADEIRLRHQFSGTSTFRLPGFVGVSPTDVPAYLTGRNTGFPPSTASATVAGGGAYTGGAACTQPPPIAPPGDDGAMNATPESNTATSLAKQSNVQNVFASSAQLQTVATLDNVLTGSLEDIARQEQTLRRENEAKANSSLLALTQRPVDDRGARDSELENRNATVRAARLSHHAVRSNTSVSASAPNMVLAGETINVPIGTLPAGKSITIKYAATVNTPPLARQASTQGTVSGTNFASVLTDDPDAVGTTNPTITLIDTLSTWTGATSTDWNVASNWTPNTYVPGTLNPGVNDVVIPNVGAQPNIITPDVNVFSFSLANGRTLTINGGRTLTISGGAAGSDLTLDGIISGGALNFAGAGPHVINNAGGTGSLSSANVTTVMSPAVVTLMNNLQMGALAVNSGATMNITNRTLSLNGSGAALTVGGTLTTTSSTVVLNGTAAQTIAGIIYNNLTINNSIGTNVTGVTLTGNATVNGVLTLTSSDLATGAFTLTMPVGATSGPASGATDVVGNVKRTGFVSGGSALSFGNPFNTIRINSGTAPTDINVLIAKNAPATYLAAVLRSYTITPSGAHGPSTLRLHYRQSELNGNSETPTANFNLRKGPTWGPAVVPTARNVGVVEDNWLENNAVTAFSEWTFSNLAPTAAGGVVTGRILADDGTPVEGAVVRLNGTQNRKFITDANGFYRFENVETNGFYIATPSRANYTFSPSSRSFSQIGETTEAAFGATLTSGGFVNPLDTPEYFVRQHYLDFLGREPDEAGFNFWSDQIIECGNDNQCIERRRENVSAAYFLSIEFQQTGGLVDGLYRASYGARPQFSEFMPDTGAVGLGVVVGRAGWQEKLEANKQAFVEAFGQRPTFRAAYDGLSSSDFVDALISHTGVSFTSGERDALVSGLANGTLTRSAVLRSIAENGRFVNAKFNEAFVMMEYFGYLRRDPDASGYAFWLNKLSEFNGNFERAEMVKAFIVSGEYRDRFPR